MKFFRPWNENHQVYCTKLEIEPRIRNKRTETRTNNVPVLQLCFLTIAVACRPVKFLANTPVVF